MSELSPGVQILIDQLKNNPDDFFGPLEIRPQNYVTRTPKFAHIDRMISRHLIGLFDISVEERVPANTVNGVDPLWFLTPTERDALKDAYTEARRLRFDAEMIARLHYKPDPEGETGPYATVVKHDLKTAVENIIGPSAISGHGSAPSKLFWEKFI